MQRFQGSLCGLFSGLSLAWHTPDTHLTTDAFSLFRGGVASSAASPWNAPYGSFIAAFECNLGVGSGAGQSLSVYICRTGLIKLHFVPGK